VEWKRKCDRFVLVQIYCSEQSHESQLSAHNKTFSKCSFKLQKKTNRKWILSVKRKHSDSEFLSVKRKLWEYVLLTFKRKHSEYVLLTFKRKHSENVLLSIRTCFHPWKSINSRRIYFGFYPLFFKFNIKCFLDAISIIFRVQWVFYSVVEKPAFTAFSGWKTSLFTKK
jgi:hypothetical protein